jgi:tetratricopeptide (TPR) repeat protein
MKKGILGTRSAPLLATALLYLAGAGCTIPIDTGLGAPKRKPRTVEETTAAGRRAYETGNPEQAKRILRNAEDEARDNPGDKRHLAATLTEIGVAQSRQGNHAEAQELHERALVLREEMYGPNDEMVAQSLNFLAASYYQTQRYDDAEKAFARALQIRRDVYGPNHRLTGLSMNNLAFFYAGVGRYEDADPLFQESIRIINAAPDASSAEKARAMDNYAAMLMDAGRAEEAEKVEADAGRYKTKHNQIQDILEMTR